MLAAPSAPKKGCKKPKIHQNPFGRQHQPEKAAHVLVTENPQGLLFSQYTVESNVIKSVLLKTPTKRKREEEMDDLEADNSESSQETRLAPSGSLGSPLNLNSIREDFPFDAATPGGTMLKTSRRVDITSESADGSVQRAILFLFSPEQRRDNASIHQVRIGGSESLEESRKRDLERIEKLKNGNRLKILQRAKSIDSRGKGEQEIDSARTLDVTPLEKGGLPITLDHSKRDRSKASSQNKIMGDKSAKEELLITLESKKGLYTPKEWDLLITLAKDYSMEWLHCLSFSLSPKKYKAQSKENLGAAPRWINTYMMVLESMAKYFLENYPGHETVVKPTFLMLPESEIVKRVDYEVTFKNAVGVSITLSNSVDALALPGALNWPSTTDLPQIKSVVNAILEMAPPCHEKRLSRKVR